jgi:propionyl-CoA carboxylase alpha chain
MLASGRLRLGRLSRTVAPLAARCMSASADRPFDKVLVANRGEIACRVFRTCQRLGINTVAVYSDADADAMHTRMADEAVRVGPAPSNESYLLIDNIVAACLETGAQAVHPGYGFLSENKLFAKALKDNGIAFIGPNEFAISVMGDKIESKQAALDANVNCIPGCQDLVETDEDVLRVSNDIGYPVMIKASAGGGGKGMRIARDDEEAKEAFRFSKVEAMASFGDDRIFIEKFVDDPRHIEIQVLADDFDNVVAFPERECSIQRRNQKVIEEAPSVLLSPETRLAMGQQAAALSRAVGYRSAGTVEFLVDNQENFFFLEMNTRLQVEHPITEMITGVDLVEHMLNIAAGRELPEELTKYAKNNENLPINGWAVESRVYAEDPFRSFLPSIGALTSYAEPSGEHVRVDSGVADGSEISMYYDPMISKLCTWGPDRATAIARMDEAVDNYLVEGPQHNLPFLREVCRHPRFLSGEITTKFIEEEYPDGFTGVVLTDGEKADLVAKAAILHVQNERRSRSVGNGGGADVASEWVAELEDGAVYGVALTEAQDGSWAVSVTPEGAAALALSIAVDVAPTRALPFFKTSVNGRACNAQVLDNTVPEGMRLQYCGSRHSIKLRTQRAHELTAHMLPKVEVDTSKFLLCPMPGSLVSVAVEEGQEVEAGQELAVVEAMKMQNVLRAEKKGTVKSVGAKAGEILRVDAVILEFE